MQKQISQTVSFGKEAQVELLKGAEILYKAVKSTMGPSGHNVIIDTGHRAPVITKDGVSVARSISLKAPLPRVGAELLKEIASKTNEVAGDGPQPLYAKVLTPNGWTTMGQLKVGDAVCGTNHTIQTVEGVYEKGSKEIYKVSFADGNQVTRIVECSSDHLWDVKTYYGAQRLMTTKQLLEAGLHRKSNNGGVFFVQPTVAYFNDNTAKLPLDPYLLGVLLGDGSLSVNHEVELALGKNNSHIVDSLTLPVGCSMRVRYYANKNYVKVTITDSERAGKQPNGTKSIIKNHLKQLGLLGTTSHTKFIPEQYLFSTLETREKLLRGLLDTDGSINSRGTFTYSTVSEQLCNDFVALCRSLGKQLSVSKRVRRLNDGSYGSGSIYRITELKGTKNGLKIIDIKPTGNFTPMRCIKVSNPNHLYITEGFVATHNTTTATVLGYSLLQQGVKMVNTGRSAVGVKRGMEKAAAAAVALLKQNSIKVTSTSELASVATISANGDQEIGELIAAAVEKVGKDGIITVEPAKSVATTLEVVEGLQLESGFISPYFQTNQEKQTCELDNPYVLITGRKLTTLSDVMGILEKILETGKPLLILADDVEGEVMHTVLVNKVKGVLGSCAVRLPGFGDARTDLMNDIALVTGATVIDASSSESLKSLELTHLGSCKKVIVGKNTTTIVGNGDEVTRQRVEETTAMLRAALTAPGIDDARKDRLKKRLAKLSGGVAILKVGGSTEVEIFEKKDRVDDALNATLAAVQEGIVPGGGSSLFYTALAVEKMAKENRAAYTEDELAGVQVVVEACKQPLRVIVENTGASADVVANKLEQQDNVTRVGYDAHNHTYCDLVTAGIIDPVKVERSALEHAVSVVGLMLTCTAVVLNDEVEV